MLEVAFIFLCAIGYRIRGGLLPWNLSHAITRGIFIASVGGALFYHTNNSWIGASSLLMYPGLSLGHGSYMDLGRNQRTDNESIRWLTRIISPKPEGSYIYDLLGLTLTGFLTTAICAIVVSVAFGEPLLGMALFIAGLLKGVTYELGWRINGTTAGEYLFGGVIGASAVYG